jgi:hypothetical protein
MNSEFTTLIICAAGIIILFVTLGFCLVKAIKNAPRQREEAKRQIAKRQAILSEDGIQMQELEASVVDLSCQVNMVGIHTPKTEKCFFVTFQTKQQEKLMFEIPEEMYQGLELGQQGQLTYIEECLYGFNPN